MLMSLEVLSQLPGGHLTKDGCPMTLFKFAKEKCMQKKIRCGLAAILISLMSVSGFAKEHSVHQSHLSTQQQASMNINDASVQQLATLKGLGMKKARAIVAFRQQHGPFQHLSDLVKVKGVGQALLKRLQHKNPGRFHAG